MFRGRTELEMARGARGWLPSLQLVPREDTGLDIDYSTAKERESKKERKGLGSTGTGRYRGAGLVCCAHNSEAWLGVARRTQ